MNRTRHIFLDGFRWIRFWERTVFRLDIPFVSQLGNVKRNDCGPACVAMILRAIFPDVMVSIEEVYTAVGISTDKYWSTWNLINALAFYGIEAGRRVGPDIEKSIRQGKGIIALVNYAHIQDWEKNPNSNFRDMHFVIVAGYDLNKYMVLDPLYPKDVRRWIPKEVFNKAWSTAELSRGAIVTASKLSQTGWTL